MARLLKNQAQFNSGDIFHDPSRQLSPSPLSISPYHTYILLALEIVFFLNLQANIPVFFQNCIDVWERLVGCFCSRGSDSEDPPNIYGSVYPWQ